MPGRPHRRACLGDRGVEGRDYALRRLTEDADARIGGGEGGEHGRGVVVGVIVDDEEF